VSPTDRALSRRLASTRDPTPALLFGAHAAELRGQAATIPLTKEKTLSAISKRYSPLSCGHFSTPRRAWNRMRRYGASPPHWKGSSANACSSSLTGVPTPGSMASSPNPKSSIHRTRSRSGGWRSAWTETVGEDPNHSPRNSRLLTMGAHSGPMQCGSAMLMQVSDARIGDIADVWFATIPRDGSSSSDPLRDLTTR